MPAIDFAARRPWILQRLLTWPTNGLFAEADGFLLLDRPAATIDQLVVAPAAKGGPTAHALLGAARRAIAGEVTLVVNADNPRAIRFYEREGFRIEAPDRNAWSGLPTWRMRAPPLPSLPLTRPPSER